MNTITPQQITQNVLQYRASQQPTSGVPSINQIRSNILNFRQEQGSTAISVPPTIPSDVLHSNVGQQDVLSQRSQLEAQAAQPTFQDFLSSMQGGDGAFDVNRMIASTLFPSQSPLQQQVTALREQAQQAGQQVRDVLADRRDTREVFTSLEAEAGLPELRERLQASSERVAQLQGELIRAEQQIMDEPGQTKIGAESRLDPLRRQMTAEITAEALIQQALVGNVAAVQQNVDRILQLEFAEEERRLNAAMMEIGLIERDIQRMEPELQQEAQARMLQFQVAMTVRSEQLQEARWNRESTLSIMSQALQSGADEGTARAIFHSQTPEEALSIAGTVLGDPLRFQQSMQLRQIQLSEASLAMQERQTQMAALQAEMQLEAEQRKEAVDEIRNTTQYDVWSTRSRLQADLDGQLKQFAGTTERKNVNWDELAKSDRFVNQLATLVVYSENPQLRRAAELGDDNARTSLAERSLDLAKRWGVGKNVDPGLLKDRVVFLDTNYNTAVREYSKVVNDVSTRYTGVSLPQYMQVSRTLDELASFSLSPVISNTLQNNWSISTTGSALSTTSILR